jgi:hypothetical protein
MTKGMDRMGGPGSSLKLPVGEDEAHSLTRQSCPDLITIPKAPSLNILTTGISFHHDFRETRTLKP